MTTFIEITEMADTIAAESITTIPHDRITTIAAEAAHLGASPVLTGIVADSAQPAVARARAFGRVTAAFLATPALAA